MKCINCHKQIEPNQNFCPECGTPVITKKICFFCQKESDLKNKFCPHCGHAMDHAISTLDESTDILPMQPRLQKPGFEAIKKHASILFADVKGSTSAIVQLDVEDANEILGPIIQKMLAAVYQYNGTIIHTAGDGIVAIFGAPISFEDHALRACLAANLMQTQLNALPGGLKIRIGIHSGEVLLDIVGNTQQHIEYDITGSAVNLAARMEHTARPGHIQITKQTLDLVGDAIKVEIIKGVKVKGFHSMDTYEIKKIKDESSLILTKYRPSFIPFVGRDDVMEQLKQLSQKAQSGQGNMVALEAEAGQGKSRIVSELLNHENGERQSVYKSIFSGGFSHTKNISLFPIVQIFKQLMNVKSKDPIDKIRNQINHFIEKIDIPYAFDAALELLNINQTSKSWNQLDASSRRRYIFLVGETILQKASLEKPLYLVIEDIHWIDDGTENFINVLLKNIHQYPILVLVTYRPGYQDGRIGKPDYIHIRLEPIAEKNLKPICDIILGNHHSIHALKNDILHACAGNPFFMQEMITSFIEDNILVGVLGNYHLNEVNFSKKVKLPESIYALLQTKIDRLPLQKKELLQTASVAGERFLYELIKKISHMDAKEIRENLNELTDLHFIYEATLYPQLEYSFNHALIQEVLYSSILKNVRHQLHIKVLEFIEQLPQEQQEEKIQLLATHAYLGQDWEKAFYYCSKAVVKNFTLDNLNLVIQYGNQALEAASHIEDQNHIIDSLVFVNVNMARCFLHMGLSKELKEHAKKAMELIDKTHDVAAKCLALHTWGIAIPELKKSLPYWSQAYQIAIENNREDMCHLVEMVWIYAYNVLGYYDKAAEIGEQFIRVVPHLTYFVPEFMVDAGAAISVAIMFNQALTGNFADFDKKMPLYQSCFKLSECNFASAAITIGLGFVLIQRGDYSDETEKWLNLSIYYSNETNLISFLPGCYAGLAYLYLKTNRIEESKQLLELAINIIESIDFSFLTANSMGLIAEGLMLSGQLERAKMYTEKMLGICKERDFIGNTVLLNRVLAEIEMQQPNPDYPSIKNIIEEALLKAKELHTVIQEAHCHVTLAKFYSHNHQENEAKKETEIAHHLFHEVDYKI